MPCTITSYTTSRSPCLSWNVCAHPRQIMHYGRSTKESTEATWGVDPSLTKSFGKITMGPLCRRMQVPSSENTIGAKGSPKFNIHRQHSKLPLVFYGHSLSGGWISLILFSLHPVSISSCWWPSTISWNESKSSSWLIYPEWKWRILFENQSSTIIVFPKYWSYITTDSLVVSDFMNST